MAPVRWLSKRTRADDGTDPAVGIPARDVSWSRLPPSSDFRLALLDDAGAVIASIDLERGDVHDMRRALSQIMAVKPNGR